jgi:hypothetical protein
MSAQGGKHVPRQSILDLVPERNREFVVEDEKVVVRVPRFDGPIGRRVTRWLTNPNYSVRLDPFGSAVWYLCDGTRTVREIAGAVRGTFGDEIEPAEVRVATFVRRLDRGRCIRLLKRRGG